jgi:MFS family permease
MKLAARKAANTGTEEISACIYRLLVFIDDQVTSLGRVLQKSTHTGCLGRRNATINLAESGRACHIGFSPRVDSLPLRGFPRPARRELAGGLGKLSINAGEPQSIYRMETASTLESMVETDIPARLDRLPWSGFHTLVIFALGITWILDGLEVTLTGSLSGALQASPALHMSAAQIGASASCYLSGAVGGAILFGWLADRLGRKRLFTVTLCLYLLATAATAFSWDFLSFALFRCLTGAGIGGEYAAINSAIQELTPARYRGRTDLIVNGSFWLGAALGAGGAIGLLRPGLLPIDLGWRIAFGIGAVLGLGILPLRRFVPESPRWLMTHGRLAEAERIMTGIEAGIVAATGPRLAPIVAPRLKLSSQNRAVTLVDVAITLFRTYPRRAALCLALMAAQAFFFNSIFFTYALVLSRFYAVPTASIGLYILPFAAGNFLGPLLLGRLFDTLGRRTMISLTFTASGVLLLITAALFSAGRLDAMELTLDWSVVFFFASAAASSAYLTVGESFPLEMRALAIALFYALGTGIGGIAGPFLFGSLIDTGARSAIAWGYVGGAVFMLFAASLELWLGPAAERRSLEELTPPLGALRDTLRVEGANRQGDIGAAERKRV